MRGKEEKCYIGVAGILPGSGVTHTALMLCKYFTGCKKKKTAYISIQGEDSTRRYSREHKITYTLDPIEMPKLDCYFNVSKRQIEYVLNQAYSYYIVDMGTTYSLPKDYQRYDLLLLLIDSSIWRKSRFESWYKQCPEGIFQQYTPVILFGEESNVKNYTYKYKNTFYAMPFNPDPLKLTYPVIQLFHKLLRE